MKKIVVSCLLVILSVVVMSGCGNKAGEEAYAEFKERYAVDFSDSEKLDEVPLLIYEVQGSYYVKMMEKDKYVRYYLWDIGSSPSKGTKYRTENEFIEAVRETEPIYEQNVK